MHVASVCNKPGAIIFGLTAPKGKWFPLNKKQKIFYPKKNINQTKPHHVLKNMLHLKVEQVVVNFGILLC